jgi:23S rRNA (guanosine2251-2'-O)-methyltransferase
LVAGARPTHDGRVQRLVYGLQPVREALRAHGSAVARVLLEAGTSPTLAALERFARDRGVPVERAGRAELDRLTEGGRHQGVAADAPPLRLIELDEILAGDDLLALALDEVQDPQNFGAVIRSAVALANAPVIWGEHASAPLTPATFRASAGAVEHARLVRVRSLRGALAQAKEAAAQVIALDASAGADLSEFDLSLSTVLVIGSEGQGVRKGVRTEATALAKLPMQGPLASLNASVAAALALYEALRQRQTKEK